MCTDMGPRSRVRPLDRISTVCTRQSQRAASGQGSWGANRACAPVVMDVHCCVSESCCEEVRINWTTRDRVLASRPHRPLSAACPQVALDRFDLFHAHLFLPHGSGNGSGGGSSRALGLLFHAAEYPARCAAFPYHLGYCQANSTLEYEEKAMDLRNIVYYQARALPEPALAHSVRGWHSCSSAVGTPKTTQKWCSAAALTPASAVCSSSVGSGMAPSGIASA